MSRGEAAGWRLLGAVLAGGASSRFGTPKWRAEVGGLWMGERAAAALRPHVAHLEVFGGDPALGALGLEVRVDLRPGLGPLGGILTALARARDLEASAVLVLACDLPLVSAELLGRLVEAWRTEDAVAPSGPCGPEPLCALYGTHLLAEVEAALDAGARSPAAFLEARRGRVRWVETGSLTLPGGGGEPLLNVNTRADRDRAESALGAASGAGEPGGGGK